MEGSSKIAPSVENGCCNGLCQKFKKLNGVIDAPFLFYSSLFSIAIIILWGILIINK
jgi:hypothetical protein